MFHLKRLDRLIRLAGLAALAVIVPKLHAELTHTVYSDALVNDWQG